MARLGTALVSLLALIVLSCRPAVSEIPKLVLWAWERPEDLRFLQSRDTAVAFLAAVIVVHPDGFLDFRLRTQQLQVNPATPLIAVTRIESPPSYAPVNTDALAGMLLQVASLPNVRSLQIDFDARSSERPLYRDVLQRVASATHSPVVSVTALASWCAGDRWLEGEPITEAVPMFFRMGRNESRNMPLHSILCLSSIGLSLDEPWPNHRNRNIDRVYVFNPRPWIQRTYLAALKRLSAWK